MSDAVAPVSPVIEQSGSAVELSINVQATVMADRLDKIKVVKEKEPDVVVFNTPFVAGASSGKDKMGSAVVEGDELSMMDGPLINQRADKQPLGKGVMADATPAIGGAGGLKSGEPRAIPPELLGSINPSVAQKPLLADGQASRELKEFKKRGDHA